ncbi:MAG: circadian clock KaiB family protein, partial [Myxococcaceae bacterium]
YVLRLYATGTTPRSVSAIECIRAVCKEHLAGRYDLEVIDLYQRPSLARDEQIVATPTLIRRLPGPLRRYGGHKFEAEKILSGVDLRALKRKAAP